MGRKEISVCYQHPESKTLVTCGKHKSKERNLRQAFKQLTEHPKFKKWHKRKTAEMLISKEEKEKRKKEIEKEVNEMMKEENLKIETFKGKNDKIKCKELKSDFPDMTLEELKDLVTQEFWKAYYKDFGNFDDAIKKKDDEIKLKEERRQK